MPRFLAACRVVVYIQHVTEPGDCCGKINPFLPTRRRPTVEHSLEAGNTQRQSLQAACRMAISRNARSLSDFPEFAQQLGMVSLRQVSFGKEEET